MTEYDLGIFVKIVMIVMASIMFFLIFVVAPINLIGQQERMDDACKDIGFDKYVKVNIQDYCTNDEINLYSIHLEEKGILPTKYTATKVNLYNYGEEVK